MAFTITLQNVLNFCSTNGDLVPLSGVGGFSNEPGLSICNDALSELLTSPNDWKINRDETGFGILVTMANKLDYLWAGASAFSTATTGNGQGQGCAIGLSSNSAISVSGGIVTITTLETHRVSVGDVIYLNGVVMSTGTSANYNSIFTDNGSLSQWTNGWTVTASNPTAKTFQFAATSGQNNSDAGGAPGITDFGWATDAYARLMSDTSSPQYKQTLYCKRELPVTHRVANPENISVQRDNGDGTIVVRFGLVPGTVAWGATVTYQKQAPVKTALTNTWSPFPDHMSALYRQAAIYRMYRYLPGQETRAAAEYQKLQAEIKKAQGYDDTEQTDVSIKPEEPLMDSSTWWWGW